LSPLNNDLLIELSETPALTPMLSRSPWNCLLVKNLLMIAIVNYIEQLSPQKKAAAIIALIVPIALFQILQLPIKALWGSGFWDFHLYIAGVTEFLYGRDPYAVRDGNGNAFIYSPIVLRLLSLFGSSLKYYLLLFYACASGWFFYSAVSSLRVIISFILALSFLGIGVFAFFSGNVTIYFHMMLLGFVLRNSWNSWLFLLCCAIFSLVKPYFMAYMFLPLLVGACNGYINRKQLIACISTVGLVLFSVGAQLYLDDFLYHRFLNTVAYQVLGNGDIGFGLYRYIQTHYPPIWAIFIHFSVILLFIVISVLAMKKGYSQISNQSAALVIYFALTVLNPRIKEYDSTFALFAISLAAALAPKAWRPLLVMVIIYVAVIIFLIAFREGLALDVGKSNIMLGLFLWITSILKLFNGKKSL